MTEADEGGEEVLSHKQEAVCARTVGRPRTNSSASRDEWTYPHVESLDIHTLDDLASNVDITRQRQPVAQVPFWSLLGLKRNRRFGHVRIATLPLPATACQLPRDQSRTSSDSLNVLIPPAQPLLSPENPSPNPSKLGSNTKKLAAPLRLRPLKAATVVMMEKVRSLPL